MLNKHHFGFIGLDILLVAIVAIGLTASVYVTQRPTNLGTRAMECVNEPDDHLKSWCASIPGGHHPDAPAKNDTTDTQTSRSDPNWEKEAKSIVERNVALGVQPAPDSNVTTTTIVYTSAQGNTVTETIGQGGQTIEKDVKTPYTLSNQDVQSPDNNAPGVCDYCGGDGQGACDEQPSTRPSRCGFGCDSGKVFCNSSGSCNSSCPGNEIADIGPQSSNPEAYAKAKKLPAPNFIAAVVDKDNLDQNYEYITFNCGRCGEDRRCQTEIGTDPQFSFGANFGSCSQVDRRPKGSSGGWQAVSLCDSSCSGGSSSGKEVAFATDHSDTPSQPTATPTPNPAGAQCQNIKIYKDGQLLDVTAVIPGDNIIVTVAGTNATKGRFRFNGAPLNNESSGFTESTSTNTSGEFTLPLTIPSNVTSIKIEAEVFKNGVWQ